MRHQIWLVAKNIYRNHIKGAGFWIMVVSPFLVGALYLIIGLIVASGVSQTPKVAVVDNPPLAQALKADQALNADITEVESHDKALSELTAGHIDGFLTEEDGKYTIVVDNQSAGRVNQSSFQTALTQVNISQTATRLGLSAADVTALLTPASLHMETQTTTGRTEGGDDRMGANIAVGTIASILIFMLLMLYVGIIGQEIGNEKSNRIMEILLAATSSNVQYYGKILGVILLAFTQIAIYGVGFGVAYPFIRNMDQVRQLQSLLTGITPSFGIYIVVMALVGIVGYLFIASIVASLVNEQAQVQQATQPIAFLAMIGYIGGIAGAAVPGNVVLRVLSFVPFISPTLMTSRYSIQFSTTAEAWIAVVLQLAATIAVAKAGERIYARNVLSYSDEKIFTQLVNNIFRRDSSGNKKAEQPQNVKRKLGIRVRIVILVLVIVYLVLRFTHII